MLSIQEGISKIYEKIEKSSSLKKKSTVWVAKKIIVNF